MGLFAFLCTVFFISTICGQNIDDVGEGDPQSKMAGQSAALFNKVEAVTRIAISSTKIVKTVTTMIISSNTTVKYGTADRGGSATPDVYEDDYLVLDRIVGGSEAVHGEISWQASVQVLSGNQFIHICGAVVIDEYWLLSAAHCYGNTQPDKWRVMVGEHHLYRQDPGEQELEVKMKIDEAENTADYDIALIKVKPSSNGRGIQFNKYVQRIRLPYPNTLLKDGTKVLVSGWGYTTPEAPQEISIVLKKTVLSVVSQEKCSQVYADRITVRMVCAGHVAGGTGACRRDSGGPLVYNDGDHYVLYGIVSFGKGCAQPNIPDVYARVTAFLPWIEDVIRSDH